MSLNSEKREGPLLTHSGPSPQ